MPNTKLRTVAAAITESAQPDGPPLPEELRGVLRTAIGRTLR